MLPFSGTFIKNVDERRKMKYIIFFAGSRMRKRKKNWNWTKAMIWFVEKITIVQKKTNIFIANKKIIKIEKLEIFFYKFFS